MVETAGREKTDNKEVKVLVVKMRQNIETQG
jgi:hypothetical protein